MSCLAPGWGVGRFGGTGGSMDNLAEQIGDNLTLDGNGLFPRLAVRLAREDKVKGNAAWKITPVAKYGKMYNILEDEVTAGHAHWVHKFRADIATEAKHCNVTLE
eukprot:1580925-Pyramimonas_sp.AAC.1